jgi:predicted aspartyl protease
MAAGTPPPAFRPTAFTCKYNVRSLTLTSDVQLCAAFAPPQEPTEKRNYKALYDTGATHSAITPRVVAELQLPSIGAMNVGVGGGSLPTTGHLVNIVLPNSVMFGMVRVASMVLHQGIDVIVGMDILGMGDFAVTHHQGKTTFSFGIPSREEIDFAKDLKAFQKAAQPKAGRNDPCPCGSGKKYKKCCGA